MFRSATVFCWLALASACSSTPPMDAGSFNTLAKCGAGYDRAISADLTAKLKKDLDSDKKISASAKDSLHAAFVTAGFSEANYAAYLSCVEKG